MVLFFANPPSSFDVKSVLQELYCCFAKNCGWLEKCFQLCITIKLAMRLSQAFFRPILDRWIFRNLFFYFFLCIMDFLASFFLLLEFKCIFENFRHSWFNLWHLYDYKLQFGDKSACSSFSSRFWTDFDCSLHYILPNSLRVLCLRLRLFVGGRKNSLTSLRPKVL